MKVLITGGAGFIGVSAALELMESGCETVLVDNFNDYYDVSLKQDRLNNLLKNRKFKLYRKDIRDKNEMENIFKEEQPEKVLHLAAMAGVRYSLQEPDLYMDVNVMGTLNLMQLSVKYGVKGFVFASSSSVYGSNQKLPFKEEDKTEKPISPYGASKKASELLAHVHSNSFGLNVIGLRFFTVYGPWGRPDMAYFKFVDKIFKSEEIEIYNFGKMERDFTYIDDIVSAIKLLMEKDFQYEIFNIGGDRVYELEKFIDVIEKEVGRRAKRKYVEFQTGDVKKTQADLNKLKKLGWNPKFNLENGVHHFVDWYKKYYKVRM